jgi:hypothetical protein
MKVLFLPGFLFGLAYWVVLRLSVSRTMWMIPVSTSVGIICGALIGNMEDHAIKVREQEIGGLITYHATEGIPFGLLEALPVVFVFIAGVGLASAWIIRAQANRQRSTAEDRA